MSKKSKPVPPEIAKQLQAIKAKGCFRCDGTGKLCNTCGESQRVCPDGCEKEDFYDCPDCKGSGK